MRRICHITDVNLATEYFRSIALYHERYDVMIGSIAPAGTLQESMAAISTPTFALGATARSRYPVAVARFARLLRRESVAAVHAHCFDPTLLGLAAARLARVPFVFTRHHSDHNIRLGKRWHTRIDAICARRADHVIAVSEATRSILTSVEGVPDARVTVVHNGMSPLASPSPESVERLRAELDLPPGPVVLMIARLHEEKGHRFLFDAYADVVRRVGPVTVLLAGDGPHRADLEAMAEARGIGSGVRFLGRRSDVPALIALSSLTVLPSLAESFGFVVLEAMSLGTPVVAAATGGIPEVVGDDGAGLLVPAADAPALADAMCRVLSDPDLARRLGESGRRRSEHFTFERMMRGYEAVYDSILSPRSIADARDRRVTHDLPIAEQRRR